MTDAAQVVVDLLNTREHSIHQDTLDPSADLLRALRSDLLAVIADPTDATHAWAAFSARVSTIEFRQDFSTPGEVHHHQTAGDPTIGTLVNAVSTLVQSGNWSRIRLCANKPCAAAFYDTTRSRTRRWHSYEICGNRTNVAAHRARTT
ncbi:CGNR zinc finger domain-containing protein [Umezawaea sp. NPDC059074]|uniref:CGNR zinc finger domain-containing protein n=1 Tax=Umezawaea sp. NPDC059074 TaxID=3346716 RepID=UPI0036899DAF